MPQRVNGPCLLNVVYGGKTPVLDLREAEAMGYKLAIVPALLMKGVVGICEQALAELKTTHRHPAPVKEMTVREMFNRFGADEWDACGALFSPPRPPATPRNSRGGTAETKRCDRDFRLLAPSPRSRGREGGGEGLRWSAASSTAMGSFW